MRIVVCARQPTMRRENTSMTNATNTKPRHVATSVKSVTLRRHQAGDGASRDWLPVAQQRLPHLAHARHATMALPHALDVFSQHVIARCACRMPGRIALTRAMRSSSRRGHPAAAKHALALRTISVARLRSRCARSSAASRSRTPRVGPAVASCSAFNNHRRSVSFVPPSLGAMAEMAAHWDEWCGSCSCFNRTARSRT